MATQNPKRPAARLVHTVILLPMVATLLFAVVFPMSGWAQESPATAPEATNVHAHDGFFLRMLLGGGYGTWSAEREGYSIESSGPNVMSMSIAIGGIVYENLSVHATLVESMRTGDKPTTTPSSADARAVFAGVVEEPSEKVCTTGCTASDLSRLGVMLGVGVTYALATNTYVSASLGFTMESLIANFPSGTGGWNTETTEVSGVAQGWGLELVVGQEWWVSDNWALGVALEGFGDLASLDNGASHTSYGGNLMFSATYN